MYQHQVSLYCILSLSSFTIINLGGRTWSQTSAPSKCWTNIGSDSTGKYLVAVNNNAGNVNTAVYRSGTGGASWAAVTTPKGDWRGIASDITGTYWAACQYSDYVGTSGFIYVSTSRKWKNNYLMILTN